MTRVRSIKARLFAPAWAAVLVPRDTSTACRLQGSWSQASHPAVSWGGSEKGWSRAAVRKGQVTGMDGGNGHDGRVGPNPFQ